MGTRSGDYKKCDKYKLMLAIFFLCYIRLHESCFIASNTNNPLVDHKYYNSRERSTCMWGLGKYNTKHSLRKTQHNKLAPFDYERSVQQRGYTHVIGVDEVGRGSIAGPVLAVSCVINYKDNGDFRPIDLVADSKELTKQERQLIYDQIHDDEHKHHYRYSISQRPPKEIEETNILKATMDCFQESIQNLIIEERLPLDQSYAIVDGKSTPKLVNGPTPIPCRPYVSADKYIYTVSIASILAKVIRDNLMVEAAQLYPEYGFDVNKGYKTKEHVEAIHKYGPCPLHRMSFKPLQYR
jgi:ribonuclease HII